MEPDKIDQLEVYSWSRSWVRRRRSWFPLWTFDDTVHETFLIAWEKLERLDRSKGNFRTFLDPRIYEPLWRKYCAMTGKRIVRKREHGKWMKRTIEPIEVQVWPLPEVPYEDTTVRDIDLPRMSGPTSDVAHLLMRGLSNKSVSAVRGTSEAATSHIVQRLRKRWRT